MGNICIKSIANPRRIAKISHPHFAKYFDGFSAVNEVNDAVRFAVSRKIAADKIVLNHYMIKSREEYTIKRQRGAADGNKREYSTDKFDLYDHNEEFDDGILAYRDERAKIYQPPDNSHVEERLLSALERNLSTPSDDLETLLTCRAVASYLKTKLADDELAKSFEESALQAVLKSLDKMTVADAQLLMRELPNILSLPYPVIKEISVEIIRHLPQIMKGLNTDIGIAWDCFINLLMRELSTVLSLPYPVIKEIFAEIIQRAPQIMKYLFLNKAWDCFIKFHHLQVLLCETHNLKQPIAARIDIKLMTTTGDFQIISKSDEKATVWKPAWFQRGSVGYQIQSYWNTSELQIVAKSTVDGQVTLELKGLDVHTPEDRSKQFPYWVDYTKLTVNGEIIFDEVTPAWHDKPYSYKLDVKADEEIKIQVEWQPHRSRQ